MDYSSKMTESPDLPSLPTGSATHYLYYKLLDIQEIISTTHNNLTKIHSELKDLLAITQYLAGLDIRKINPNYEPIRNFLEAERQTHNSPIVFDCPILDSNKYQSYPFTPEEILRTLLEGKPKSPEPENSTDKEIEASTSAVRIPLESGTRPMKLRTRQLTDPKGDLIFNLFQLNATLKQVRRQVSTIITHIESNPEELQNVANPIKKKIQPLLDIEEIDINEVKTNLLTN